MSNTPTIAKPSHEHPREYTSISAIVTQIKSSAQNPNPKTSRPNPDESVRSFSFQARPVQILKRAINGMCDPEAKELELAYINVNEKGFEIRVGNKEDSTHYFPDSALIDFQCRKPFTVADAVNLAVICWGFAPIDDDDNVTVDQVDGLNKNFFMFESSFPIGRLSANFLSSGKNIVPALPLNSNLSLERLREISTWVRSSEQNADESIRSFSFQLKPALLKRALLVLCDSEVNETGFAYIHVDEKGCVITVDTKEGCTGVLLLSPSRLMNFQCRKPSTEAQIVSLNTVYWSLAPVNDNDTITVFQVDGSDQLSFVFEKYVGIRGLSVNLRRCSNNIGKFPEIKCYRNSSLESHDLSRIFRQYARAAAQRHLRVAAKIGQNELDFLFMDEGEPDFCYDHARFFGNIGKVPWVSHINWFHWDFPTVLVGACKLVDLLADVRVSFSSLPEMCIVFQFNLTDLGDLMILKTTL